MSYLSGIERYDVENIKTRVIQANQVIDNLTSDA